MKRNLLHLCVLISSICMLATSCGKNDVEDFTWKQLPDGIIKAENFTLTLNGEDATGNIIFKPASSTSAQMEFTNVIDGYSTVLVNLTMEKQSDGSFDFSGTQYITTKPVTKDINVKPVFLTVTVEGNITLDGTVKADITTSGTALYIGTYAGETLILSRGKDVIIGKTVVLDATDATHVSLLIKEDVIAGETETIIYDVNMQNGEFSGTTEADNATIAYTGSLKNKVLTLTLNVTMKDPANLAKTYSLGAYKTGSFEFYGEEYGTVTNGALYVNWEGIDDDTYQIYSGLLRGIGGMLLPQLLQSITLEADGNITAKYSSGDISFDQDQIMGMVEGVVPSEAEVNALIPTSGWQTSGTNVAYWYQKDGKLYIKLDIASIVVNAMGPDAGGLLETINTVLKGDAASFKDLMKKLNIDLSSVSDESINMLLSWANDGIPMTVKNTNGHTYLYLDKETLAPIFKNRGTEDDESYDIFNVWMALTASGIIPEEMQPAGFMLAILPGYYNNSTAFDLGLDLIAK